MKMRAGMGKVGMRPERGDVPAHRGEEAKRSGRRTVSTALPEEAEVLTALRQVVGPLSAVRTPMGHYLRRRSPSGSLGGASRARCAVAWSLWWRVVFLSVMMLPEVALGQTALELYEEQQDHRVWEQAGGCKGARIYLNALPQGLHATEAHECLAWAEVQGCEDAGSVERFLADHPEGRHAAEARECLTWLDVKSCEDVERVVEFRRRFPDGRYATEAAACVALDRKRREAERQLAICRAHRDAGRLTVATGGNALICYHKVLGLDSLTHDQMREALDGIAGIEAHYTGKARTALERERPEAAESAIERLKKINPEHPEVETLEAALTDLERVLADRLRGKRALEALIDNVEALLSKREYEQARTELAAGRKAGLDGKALAAFEERIDRDALVTEVRTLVGAGNVTEARARLAEARKGLLSEEDRARLEATIKEAETAGRDALVADAMVRLEQNEYGASREALERARALGLPEARYEELSERIARSEREARLSALLPTCMEHVMEERYAPALGCYREVLALEPGHADAQGVVAALEMDVAWEEAKAGNTEAGYLEFERAHPDSKYVGLSQCERKKLQGAEC